MTLYVLDTDQLSLLEHEHPLLRQRVEASPPKSVAITVVTVEEQLTGWYTLVRQSKRRERLARAYQSLADSVEFLSPIRILSFTLEAIDRFEALRSMRLGVASNDLRIAAIVLEYQAVLVTRNARDFRRIPGLTLEDWTV